MNYEAAIYYVQQRMRELGKSPEQYHWHQTYVIGTVDEVNAGYFEIAAYNELYILIKPETYFGLFILSDNSAFNSEDKRQSGVLEFTGVIRFAKIGPDWNLSGVPGLGIKPFPVEFIKVVIY